MRPDLYTAFNPWDRITTPEAVSTLLRDGGAQSIEVAAEDGYQALRTPEDFWTIALGSGLRWTIDQMGVELAREVKHEILDRLADQRGQSRRNQRHLCSRREAARRGLTTHLTNGSIAPQIVSPI